MESHGVSRRRLLQAAGSALAGTFLAGSVLSGAAGLGGCASSGQRTAGGKGDRRRVTRLAHLTDLHIQPERGAGEGVAQCLRAVQAMPDRPSMVLTGGDLVMDAYDQKETRTREVFDVLTGVLESDCGLPVKHTLGNHDIWGWNRPKSGMTGAEPLYGKAYAIDRLGMSGAYHHFDIGAGPGSWRVIVLDSVRPSREPGSIGYEAFLEPEQFDWLKRTLADTPKDRWVMLCSHVPIVSVAAALSPSPPRPMTVSTSLMHADARELRDLFLKHPAVKLAVAGHLHERETLAYDGVTYACAGAVCGAWWKGRHKRCDEGYSTIDLFDDGSFDMAYHTYGWKAREEAPA